MNEAEKELSEKQVRSLMPHKRDVADYIELLERLEAKGATTPDRTVNTGAITVGISAGHQKLKDLNKIGMIHRVPGVSFKPSYIDQATGDFAHSSAEIDAIRKRTTTALELHLRENKDMLDISKEVCRADNIEDILHVMRQSDKAYNKVIEKAERKHLLNRRRYKYYKRGWVSKADRWYI